MTGLRNAVLFATLLLSACGGGEESSSTQSPETSAPAFPADYASTYTEVRNCRPSGDHDLNTIRVLADPAALGPYLNHDKPMPVGSVLLKEEYEFSDATCSGAVKQWTVMVRLAAGAAPEKLDWHWETVDAHRNVVGEDTPRCYGCHTGCTDDVGGYEYSCTVP